MPGDRGELNEVDYGVRRPILGGGGEDSGRRPDVGGLPVHKPVDNSQFTGLWISRCCKCLILLRVRIITNMSTTAHSLAKSGV